MRMQRSATSMCAMSLVNKPSLLKLNAIAIRERTGSTTMTAYDQCLLADVAIEAKH
jgi:hypothetical protein